MDPHRLVDRHGARSGEDHALAENGTAAPVAPGRAPHTPHAGRILAGGAFRGQRPSTGAACVTPSGSKETRFVALGWTRPGWPRARARASAAAGIGAGILATLLASAQVSILGFPGKAEGQSRTDRSERYEAPEVVMRDLAGVSFPDTASIEGKPVVLNGLGLRTKYLFKIYVAALYLEKKSTDAGAVIASNDPKQIVLHFVYGALPKEKLVEAWNEGFRANSAAMMPALAERIGRFNACMEDVRAGDRIELSYLPDRGVRVRVKGADKGWIEGKDFMEALFSIWLGSSPVQGGLKTGLLGG